MSKKILFISSFHPLISRNIINTSIVKLLQEYYQVIVLVPNFKLFYFEKEFKNKGLIFEGIDVGSLIRTKRVGILKRLAEALPPTHRALMGRKLTLTGVKKNFFYYYLFYLPASLLGRSHFLMNLIRYFDYFCSPRGRFFYLFKKYKPDLIFSTDIQNEHDVALLQDAKKYNIPTISMVRSWDNLVTRAIRIIPEEIIVHNEIIKEQAVTLYGIKPSIIEVAGIPHYDRYLKGSRKSRETFFEDLSFDLHKKTVLFFPLCDYRVTRNTDKSGVNMDGEILETLAKLNVNVVVRFPPNETVSIGGFKKPENFFYDKPGYFFENNIITTREITDEDNEQLIDELTYTDVVVSGPSTAVIDSAFFDVPAIFVDFNSNKKEGDIGQVFEYKSEHIVNVIETLGVKIARSPDELLTMINNYFLNRQGDSEGRKRIVREQCFATDGRASERVASVIISRLSSKK